MNGTGSEIPRIHYTDLAPPHAPKEINYDMKEFVKSSMISSHALKLLAKHIP